MKKEYIKPIFSVRKISLLKDVLVESTPLHTDGPIPIATTAPAPEIGEEF